MFVKAALWHFWQFALVSVNTVKPTQEQAAAYQKAFDHYNKALFSGKLPFAYLNFSRHAGAKGFFSPERWGKAGTIGTEGRIHEISLNPDLLLRPPVEYYSTLVHEMCHHWQHVSGSPSRNGYHNMEWARKMVEVGLIPTDTGEPGGKPTGQRVTHYIEPNGKFMQAFKTLPEGALLPWVSGGLAEEKAKKPAVKKYKFTCPECETPIWALTPELEATCAGCGQRFLGREEYRDWEREQKELGNG
jgi:hypothetical protein